MVLIQKVFFRFYVSLFSSNLIREHRSMILYFIRGPSHFFLQSRSIIYDLVVEFMLAAFANHFFFSRTNERNFAREKGAQKCWVRCGEFAWIMLVQVVGGNLNIEQWKYKNWITFRSTFECTGSLALLGAWKTNGLIKLKKVTKIQKEQVR